MTNKINYKILYTIVYIIFGLLFFIVLKQIFDAIDAYYDFVYYFIIMLYLFLGISLYIKQYKLSIITYYLTLFAFLFLRKTEPGINLNFYLFEWLKKVFTNKTIFLNIVGNIILFIPLGIINKNILKSIIIILLIETLQLTLKKGIFDVVDIILNTVGVLLGFLGEKLWMIIKKKKKI